MIPGYELKLQTNVNFSWDGPKLGADAIVAGLGSCFVHSQLNRLYSLGIGGCANPAGIVYNAVSMAEVLEHAASDAIFRDGDFFETGGLWHSRLHHGAFSRPTPTEAAAAANIAMDGFRRMLPEADLVVLTPSSSVVYADVVTGEIFSNCHRLPQSCFNRRSLSFEENMSALERCVAAVRGVNRDALIIFSVSPIRHYPGDLVLNSRSKATLLAAVAATVDATPDAVYFPAYEIVNDELRDYRYYAEDLLHPTPLTEKIIFSRFTTAFFDAAARDAMAARERENQAAAHRPRQIFGV